MGICSTFGEYVTLFSLCRVKDGYGHSVVVL